MTPYDDLKKAAGQATKGPWRSDCILPPEHATRLHTVRSADSPPSRIIAENCYERDGVYIALANPTTILALLARLEAMNLALHKVGGYVTNAMDRGEEEYLHGCDILTIINNALRAYDAVKEAHDG